jgi:hypothetical protein
MTKNEVSARERNRTPVRGVTTQPVKTPRARSGHFMLLVGAICRSGKQSRSREKEKNTASMYEYEIAKIILALWIGLNLTYGSLVIGLVIGSRCAKFIGVGLKRIRTGARHCSLSRRIEARLVSWPTRSLFKADEVETYCSAKR